MSTVRLAIVSDTHLSQVTPEAQSNWKAVLGHLASDPPDLVIHAGDLTGDGTHDPQGDRWLAAIRADWWTERLGDWTIVAIDAQLFGSGVAAEAEQAEWLEHQLRGGPGGDHVPSSATSR